MAKTLQQLRTLTLDHLRETASDSHFTTDQLNGYINQAQEYIAAISSPPEDLVSVATEANKGAYLLPSDNILITSAYFGDTGTFNDVRPLKIISKTNAKYIFPSWLDETNQSSGEPTHLWYLDNSTVFIYPKPNTANASKRLYLYYGFSPTSMTNDGDVPDIKNNYHVLIPILASAYAYYALPNVEVAKELLLLFKSQYSDIKDTIEKESEESLSFKWSVPE